MVETTHSQHINWILLVSTGVNRARLPIKLGMKAPRRSQAHLNVPPTVLFPVATETKVPSSFLCKAGCLSHRISSLISFKENRSSSSLFLPYKSCDLTPSLKVPLAYNTVYTLVSRLHGYSRPCLHSKWRDFKVEKVRKYPMYRDQWPNFSPPQFPDLSNKGVLRRPGDPPVTCWVSSYLAYLCTSPGPPVP